MFLIHFGKLTYSNCALRQDVLFGFTPNKHLFWCFWIAT